jgi:hypothetical protein
MFFRKGKQLGGGFGLEVLEFHFPHAGKSLRIDWRKIRSSRWETKEGIAGLWGEVVGI